jgi:uncharacterized protein
LRRELSFWAAVICELALLMLALLWGLVFGRSLLGSVRWDSRSAAFGLIAALPLFVCFLWTLKSRLPVFSRHRHLLNFLVHQLFGKWRVWQLAAISVCAGVCEEALFRGALQASLVERVGAGPAIALVSLLFGASHLLSWTYGIIAAGMGVYLGLLFYFSDNLLAPIVTHGLYDFAALVYLMAFYHSAEKR